MILRSEQAQRILRIKQVMEATGLGRSTIYLWMKEGRFPKPLRLGARAVGWSANSVFEWIAAREVA